MRFELFIALRYLLSRRKHGFISAISLISVAGVALGVAALIVVLGVMNGFSDNLRDKILGVNAHIIVSSISGPMDSYASLQDRIEALDGVQASMPFIYTEVMLSTQHGVKGSAVRGISPDQAEDVMSLGKDLIQGRLADLSPGNGDLPGIVLGRGLASRLGAGPGDVVHMLVPSGRSTAAGFAPQVKNFAVAGVFKTGMYEYDSSLAYIHLRAAQKSLGFTQDLISGLEVRIKDVYAAESVGTRIARLADHNLAVQTWMDMNRSLFSALKLEKTAMAVILVMIVLVGSFSIITTLIMLVMDKKQDIAVLMSLGCQPGHIKRIFMLQGTIIGMVGTAFGFFGGLSLSAALQKYQFIQLPSDVYHMEHLPVKLELLDLGLIGLAALVLCFAATIYPARQAARVHPAEVLRYE